MEHLRAFYEVMGACGLARPPWEAWLAHATENAELWPLLDHTQTPPRLFGGVLFKGHTVHIAIHPDYQRRWISKRLFRAYEQWEHDCEIIAHPPVENVAARNLAHRLGFKYRGDTDNGLFAIYVKEPTCRPQ